MADDGLSRAQVAIVKDLMADAERLQAGYRDLEARVDGLRRSIEIYVEEITRLRAENEELRAWIKKLEIKNAELRGENARLRAELELVSK